ncbi:DNA-binding response OmpR family regulator [Parabacteroides sp. PF5-5]|uniref:response regulator transcription factor n=1 Tax=unclassified Parabacteroides TaxID=2649774 RepID=UPI0024767B73|nr:MULTISPECIES: response regulator transcription factor [unclassified Parabacteroides]MDH6303768.1 DNA-binding response OmpR family regulator [Parabacteroides sp. PH5-39]MDH6314385.1 DNA-binding response OmpR family regulator [Parabacteroides sp. PF5-13]MDH6318550.1 DNA-binding response OmpR family regulator [Parabacteroides sp. PH5-13]MDH6322157.1 DNA-binding response OmpR family regulator [Parabacteroides sp. PH5-8]MDH6325763.1 DNA-binding response OmpR family regulator [Parabacteroides sp.
MKILLVEDEVNIASFIERGLQELGYEVRTAYDGEAGWELVQEDQFQLLILDVIMPKMDGLELCRKYREAYGYASPVIMLTALGTTDDIVKGLAAGADDYLVKPFSFQELDARIQALLRRSKVGETSSSLSCGDLVLETENRRAIRKGEAINLTVREYRLLEYLMLNQGTPLSRENIIKQVWDKEADRNMNVVDVYVNYLRTKIDKGFDRKLIRTVSGIGYMIEA